MSQALLIQTRKEIRALLPWTIGVGIGCAALALSVGRPVGSLTVRNDQQAYFIMAYALGVMTVAALSIGHELTHRTLATLLVQPVDRMRLVRLKLAVLAIALVGLGLLGGALIPHDYALQSGVIPRRLLIWAPVAAGIGLVPLLTLLTRRPLGGVVFAVTIPGLLLTIGERIYPFHRGLQALDVAWYGTLLASAVGLGIFLLQFRRLEVAGDGRERASTDSTAGSRDAVTVEYRPTVRRPWVWLLVKKELRLQQMTMAVSGLYVLGAAAVMILQHLDLAHYVGPTFNALSMLHASFIPLIAGAASSAEERHIGTLAGQVLQPRDMRLQWILKVIVTIGLTLALAFGLPAVLMAVHLPVEKFHMASDLMIAIAMLCAGAMYVSSFSSNSLWALLGCFPVIGLAIAIGAAGRRFLLSMVYQWFSTPRSHVNIAKLQTQLELLFRDKAVWKAYFYPRQAAFTDVDASLRLIQMSLIVGFGLLILYFAARNHRMLDRSLRTVSRQLIVLLAFAAISTTAYWTFDLVVWRWIGTLYW